jgi:uncharacterized protein YrrD
MRFSEIKNRAVVDLDSAQKIGQLESLVLDPAYREVVGLKIKSGGLFGPTEFLPISRLKNIGQDAITISQPLEAAVASGSQDTSDSQLKNLPDLQHIVGKQVVTSNGKLLGDIHDITLDSSNLAITGYEISTGGLFAKKHQIPATQEINFGPAMVVIPDQLVTQYNLAE